MTMSEPPSLVSEPRPLRPMAKMVGNMMDMKRLVRRMAQVPARPGWAMPTASSRMLRAA